MAGVRVRGWMAMVGVAVLMSAVGIVSPVSRQPVGAQAPVLFVMPTADQLAADAAGAVNDTPVPGPDTIDLTPVMDAASETVDSLPADQWQVDALAKTLSDPTSAFELVRDSMGFDAYPGVLRGADGTLAARAGNSYDRALLLQALLGAQGLTTRFAFGQLSPDVAASLVTRSLDEPAKPLSAAAFSPFDPAFEQAVDTRARRDYALISNALGDRVADLAADGTAAAVADVTSHAWVQLQQADGTWLDLDPTMPDAQPGQTLTDPSTTADTVPLEQRQTVTLRVIAETLQDGTLGETVVLDVPLDAAAAAGQQVLLTFAPASSGGGLINPGGLLGGGGGDGTPDFVPVLLIDSGAWHGDPISISASGGGGGLLGGGGSPTDLAGLSIEVQTDAPGLAPQVTRHVIADRVPAPMRASGSVTPEDLLPIQDSDGVPAIFATVLHLMLSTGGSSPRSYAERQGMAVQMAGWQANAANAGSATLDAGYLPAAVSDEVQVVAAEQRLLPSLQDDDVRAFVATPRIYLASRAVDAADPTLSTVQTDLLTDSIRTLPRAGAAADAAARHQLWYGALQGAVETENAIGNAGAIDPGTLTMAGVSFDMDKPLSILTAADTTLPAAADGTLRSTLDAGGLAVVPGDPVAATTWWQVAADGTTRSILAPRSGGNWLRGLFMRKRVVPVVPSNPGGNGKGGGNEYQNTLKVEEQVEPVVEGGSQVVADTFETSAETLKAIARKKLLGG